MEHTNSKRKHFINDIEVADDIAQKMLSVQEYHANDAKIFELYNDFVSQQKEPFKAIMYYFNDTLTELKKEGKISDFVEFRARIKAPESAINNDQKKILDDVFAMEFIGATETEVKFILNSISKKTIVRRQKSHNKPNGYKAEHRVFSLNEETQQEISEKFKVDKNFFPVFECQFKTIQVAIAANTGTAAHINYKGIDPKIIQRKYDNNEFQISYNIPQMWVSRDAQMVKLSSDETLRKLYPFLNITKKKSEQEHEK